MSKSSPIGLPENVKIFDRAVEDFVLLDGRQQKIVLKALIKIARAPSQFGEPLGNQGDRFLSISEVLISTTAIFALSGRSLLTTELS